MKDYTMEKKKIQAREKLMQKRMSFRFYFVVILLLFGVIIDFLPAGGGLVQLGFLARYMGVLGLVVYAIFFVCYSALPEKKESLQALAQSFYISLFAFAIAGFILMILGQNKVLAIKISTIVAFFSLVLVLTSLLAFRHLNRKAFK